MRRLRTRWVAVVWTVLGTVAAQAAQSSDPSVLADLERRLEQGDLDGSRRILEVLVRQDPLNPVFWLNLGNVYLAQNQEAPALESYQKCLELPGEFAPFARAYSAMVHLKHQRFRSAFGILAEVRRPDTPADPLLERELEKAQETLYRHVYEKYGAGDFSGAWEDLKFLSEPQFVAMSNPRLDLVAGQSLFQLHQPALALGILQRANDAHKDPEAANQARQVLESLQTLEPPRPELSEAPPSGVLLAELSYGYNSNVFARAPAIAGSASIAGAPVGQVLLGIDKGILERRGVSARIGLFSRLEEVVGSPEERYLGFVAQTQVGVFQRGVGWFADLSPFLKYELFGNQPYFLRPGFRAKAGYAWERRFWYLGTEWQRNLPRNSEYSYLGGRSAFASAHVGTHWAAFALEGVFGYSRDDNQDLRAGASLLPLAFDGLTLGFSATYEADELWLVRVQPNWTWKYFDTHTMPDDLRRIDLQISFALRAERRMADGWSIFVGVDGIVNQSTLGADRVADKNFQQYRGALGLSWDLEI